MTRQQGRGSMGTHKHGTSGTAGMPPNLRQFLALIVNKQTENKKRARRVRQQAMYSTVRELMAKRKQR